MVFPRLRDSASGRGVSSRNLVNTFLRDSTYRRTTRVFDYHSVQQEALVLHIPRVHCGKISPGGRKDRSACSPGTEEMKDFRPSFLSFSLFCSRSDTAWDAKNS